MATSTRPSISFFISTGPLSPIWLTARNVGTPIHANDGARNRGRPVLCAERFSLTESWNATEGGSATAGADPYVRLLAETPTKPACLNRKIAPVGSLTATALWG